MSSNNEPLRRALARRVGALGKAPVEAVELRGTPPPSGLLDELRRHLLAGETHYTTRPGLVELREQLAERIRAAGGPEYDPRTEVVVTAGAGEAMFAALLGSGATAAGRVSVEGAVGRHAELLGALDVEAVHVSDAQTPANEIMNIRIIATGAFGTANEWSSVGPHTIVIGSLDDLPGMDAFRVGYVVGPAEVIGKIMTWKQAFSICTAAPSQRAAIWTLDRAREDGQ